MLKIDDINEVEELDQDGMSAVEGGVYRSAKSSYVKLQSADPLVMYKNELFLVILNTQ
jgi:hypothetical protein